MKIKRQIPYGRQWIDEKDIKTVVKTLRSGWITQGPQIEEFEREIAKYAGAKYAVAVNSGTSALLAACSAINLAPGDEVITSPYTFVASANCFVWFGAKPVFVDIEENTFNIDPQKLEFAITKKTRAIITVDFAGLPCNYTKILKIAKKHNLVVIDDASHAFGASYRDKKIGAIADITCFSFHPVKSITTGEGGMIVTGSRDYFQRATIFRNHGITKDKGLFNKNDGEWYYEMINLGLNFRLTDIQAVLGLSQIKKVDRFIERRGEIANIYKMQFSDIAVTLPDPSTDSSWHLYPVRLKLKRLKTGRGEIFDELKKKGLGVQVHYIPIHLQPYYRKRFGFKRGDFPVAESAYESEISLPLFPKMTSKEIAFVVKTFKNVIQKHQK